MTRFWALALAGLTLLIVSAPALVAIAHATVRVVIAAGGMFLIVRIAWYFSNRW